LLTLVLSSEAGPYFGSNFTIPFKISDIPLGYWLPAAVISMPARQGHAVGQTPIDYLQWMARQTVWTQMQAGARHKHSLGERKGSDEFFSIDHRRSISP